MTRIKRPFPTDSIVIADVKFTHDDIYKVVDEFYRRIQSDEFLKVPFASVHDWPHHIDRLTHFWWMKFGGDRYLDGFYNPVLKHYQSGFTRELLARWLDLFHETLNDKVTPEQNLVWKTVTERMGEGLAQKNEMLEKMHGVAHQS